MSDPHAPARRAALDELVRPPGRRSLFRRPATASGAAPDDDAGGMPPGVPGRWLAALGAAALLVALVAGWGWIRRPPAADSTLPHATETASTTPSDRAPTPGAPSTATSGAPASASPSTPAGGTDTVTVHVAGAVARPGVVSLPAGSRAVDAVAAAGGMVVGADPDRVNLAAKLTDGQRLAIPLVGQPAPAEVAPAAGSGGAGDGGGAGPASGPVDLNSATADQLDALPGVGPATAAAIISYRTEHGPFRTVDDLLEVRGIGDAKLDSLRGAVTVGAP